MKTITRIGVARWLLIAITITLAIFALPNDAMLTAPLQFVAMIVLVALFANIGFPMTYGLSTFVPMVALTAYLTLGLAVGLWTLLLGLAIGGSVTFGRLLGERDAQFVWWSALADAMWPMAAHGLSIWFADFAYQRFGYSPPLTQIAGLEALLPVVAAAVFYLLAHNLLLTLDAWLSGRSPIAFFGDNLRVLLAAQVLPLPLAPVSAVALALLGLPAYFISIVTLLAVAIAVNRLVLTQANLRKQVRQLSSFSSVNRAMRASLQLEPLLDNIYRQIGKMMAVENFYVVLLDPDTSQFVYPFVVRDGQREERPSRERSDTFEEWVVDEQKPLFIAEDVDTVAKRMELLAPEAGLQSWMGVPLQVLDRTFGCMAVYTVDNSSVAYDKEDMEILGNVASQASVAIQNALLYENAKQHSTQMATLNEISGAINASLDPDQVLDLVSKSITRVAGCDKAAIYLLTEDKETLNLGYAEGFSDGYRKLSQTVTVPLTDEERNAVLQTGKVIAVSDIRSDENVSAGMVVLAANEHFRSYANFPLRAHGQSIGLLSVYYDTTHQFQESELELLQTFANQAALAVANARRYTVTDKALGRRVEQIVAISDINRKLSATLDLDRVFHLVTDAAVEACMANAGLLLVADEANGTPRIGSWRGYKPEAIQRFQRSQQAAAQGISARVLNSGQTVLVDDVSREPGFVNMLPGARSQLSVPVLADEQVIGVITLESIEESAFTEEDVEFVSQLANQAGIAIKNAQLYKRLSEVNDRLHAILDSSSDGLLMIDTAGRIVMTNTRMESFWDFARHDFEERTVDEFVADPLSVLGEGLGYSKGEITTLIKQASRDPEMEASQDLYVTESEDSPQLFVERTASPVRDEFSNLIGLLMVFRDVTEQKELEEAREDLANMLIHDLRNPLTAVLASLALVRNVVGNKDETGIANQATEVSSRAVRKLLVMINNLLDLSRLETGEFAPEQRATPVSDLVDNAVGEMLPLALEMEVTVTVAEGDELASLPQVNVDRDMLERVLLNLLDNALKFSSTGGTVLVRVSPYEAQGKPDGKDEDDAPQMLHWEVIDNGPGIPDEYKKRIFQRYEQVRGQKGRRRGTGLGLAFCQITINAHGGEIWVSDNPDEGSIFNFTLPVADVIELPSDKQAASGSDDSSGEL